MTDGPVTDGPVTDGPVTDGPVTDGPVTDGPSGSALIDAVAVMDRLRSPGGCPWDADQTHVSLLRYLVEETYELYDAVADGDRRAMREELGDVLLQVLFHARLAQEDPVAPFGIDDVAAELVVKLVGRHPHVFTEAGRAEPERVATADAQQTRWEELKAVEKRRASALDGVSRSQPAVALAAKYISRARRAGVPDDLLARVPGDGVGSELYAAVARAGGDPEGALRDAAGTFAGRVRAAEEAARAAGEDPTGLDEAGWRRYWPAD